MNIKDFSEKEIPLDSFPSPEELWNKYLNHKGVKSDQEKKIKPLYVN